MQKERPQVKKPTLFDSDAIANQVASAVCSDMSVHNLFDIVDIHGVRKMLGNLQREHVLKRYVPADLDRKPLDAAARSLFLSMNLHMQETNLKLISIFPESQPDRRLKLCSDTLLQRSLWSARLLIKQVLGRFDYREFFFHCQNGEGASVGVSLRDSCEEAKFTYPITGTANAIALSKLYMAYNIPLMAAVEKLNKHNPKRTMYKEISGSQGTTVDKTATKLRLIAKEGTLNMFFQLGLMEMMFSRLSLYGLDVETLQPYHRRLAMLGSIDCSVATIDSTSASDCVAFELVKWLLPQEWFEALNFVRSPVMELEIEGTTTSVPLEMFSSMGNAVTFPLETLLFWALSAATNHHVNSRPGFFVDYEKYTKVSTFGDDVIVPNPIAPDVMNVLEAVGFIINEEKSFFGDEHFRESCGGDYFHGFNVRPFCFKAPHTRKLSSLEPWLYIILNNLLPRYIAYYGGCFNIYGCELFSVMARIFRENNLNVKVVPSDFPDDAGLRCGGTSDFGNPRMNFGELTLFLHTHGFTMEPIMMNEEGMAIFRYCRFVYKKTSRRFSQLHYALSLTKDERDRRDWGSDFQYCRTREAFILDAETIQWARSMNKRSARQILKKPDKRIGGYVVSKAWSSLMDLATFNAFS
jgi:hypothetical protein